MLPPPELTGISSRPHTSSHPITANMTVVLIPRVLTIGYDFAQEQPPKRHEYWRMQSSDQYLRNVMRAGNIGGYNGGSGGNGSSGGYQGQHTYFSGSQLSASAGLLGRGPPYVQGVSAKTCERVEGECQCEKRES